MENKVFNDFFAPYGGNGVIKLTKEQEDKLEKVVDDMRTTIGLFNLLNHNESPNKAIELTREQLTLVCRYLFYKELKGVRFSTLEDYFSLSSNVISRGMAKTLEDRFTEEFKELCIKHHLEVKGGN